ncbi:antitoxin Xre/MbcA/ParS toxin-binding domain-containing protein [Pseudomonas putida]
MPSVRHSQSGARFHLSTLSPDQHDRYLDVLEAAKKLYSGDFDAAIRWMSHPVKAFDGKAPASMVATRLETDTVIEFIRRLEHGFVA